MQRAATVQARASGGHLAGARPGGGSRAPLSAPGAPLPVAPLAIDRPGGRAGRAGPEFADGGLSRGGTPPPVLAMSIDRPAGGAGRAPMPPAGDALPPAPMTPPERPGGRSSRAAPLSADGGDGGEGGASSGGSGGGGAGGGGSGGSGAGSGEGPSSGVAGGAAALFVAWLASCGAAYAAHNALIAPGRKQQAAPVRACCAGKASRK